jgi:hypothetical protein
MVGDLKTLRGEAVELLQELAAILLLTNSVEKKDLAALAEEEAYLMKAISRKDLRAQIKKWGKEVAKWRVDKQVHASRADLIGLLKGIRATPKGKFALVRKAHLVRLIGTYNEIPKPAHCQIIFEKDGIDPANPVIQWRLLEALLYEDMCSLYNFSRDLSGGSGAGAGAKYKQLEAVRRAVVTASFISWKAILMDSATTSSPRRSVF